MVAQLSTRRRVASGLSGRRCASSAGHLARRRRLRAHVEAARRAYAWAKASASQQKGRKHAKERARAVREALGALEAAELELEAEPYQLLDESSYDYAAIAAFVQVRAEPSEHHSCTPDALHGTSPRVRRVWRLRDDPLPMVLDLMRAPPSETWSSCLRRWRIKGSMGLSIATAFGACDAAFGSRGSALCLALAAAARGATALLAHEVLHAAVHRLFQLRSTTPPAHRHTLARFCSFGGAGPSNALRLFHGTPIDTVFKIVREGFRLPDVPVEGGYGFGMFGCGTYLARSPLKSLQYCFKPSKESLEGKRGYLLLCSAELGVCRLAPHVSHVYMNLHTSHTIAAEAMAGSTAWGLPAYDSTYARGDERRKASGVFMDEFCVYEPNALSRQRTGRRVSPEYVIEVDIEPQRMG